MCDINKESVRGFLPDKFRSIITNEEIEKYKSEITKDQDSALFKKQDMFDLMSIAEKNKPIILTDGKQMDI